MVLDRERMLKEGINLYCRVFVVEVDEKEVVKEIATDILTLFIKAREAENEQKSYGRTTN